MRSETPMLDMLHGASGRVRLHMPGHKGRLPAEWVNSALDTTEIGPTDDLFSPCGGHRARTGPCTPLPAARRTRFF